MTREITREKKPRLLIMADCHIKSRTWTNFTRLSGDAYTALNEILKYNNLPETAVIAGDWFDSTRPSGEDLVKSIEFLRNFKKVLYIKGNHDSQDYSFLGVLETAEMLTQTPIELSENLDICGVSWQASKELELQLIEECTSAFRNSRCSVHILVLHTAFKHLMGIEGAYRRSLAELESILRGLNVFVICGDIHIRDFRHIGESSLFLSPGSLYPVKTTEMNLKHLRGGPVEIMFNTDDSDKIEGAETFSLCCPYKDVPCKVRDYSVIDYEDTLDSDRLRDALDLTQPRALPPYIRIKIPDSSVQVDRSLFPDNSILHLVSADATVDSFECSEEIKDDCSMADAIVTSAGASDMLKELGLSLYASDDPQKSVEGWLDFWNAPRIK